MKPRITVVGMGYLGTTQAIAMAEMGFDVVGMDIDATRISALNEGLLPFYEPELEPLLRKHVAAKRLQFTTSYVEAAAQGDVYFLCVGTPQRKADLAADLTYMVTAVDGLVANLNRDCLLVGKSTVPVGTAAMLSDRIASYNRPCSIDIAWSPEFLREGHALYDTLTPDRIVVGVRSDAAADALRHIYASQIRHGIPFVVTDFATAELVKMAANAFLATKVSFINFMAEICDRTGADVQTLARAMGYDDRIGRKYLNAGIGFGGGCLPKDIRGFAARAEELGLREPVAFLRQVDAINLHARERLVNMARDLCDGSLVGKRIAALGAAFKPNSDDIRDSPALSVANSIQRQGGNVNVYDPRANDNAQRSFPTLAYADTFVQACRQAHLVLILTEWQEFRDIDPETLGQIVERRRIIDGRYILDPMVWQTSGWIYRAPGRGQAAIWAQEAIYASSDQTDQLGI